MLYSVTKDYMLDNPLQRTLEKANLLSVLDDMITHAEGMAVSFHSAGKD